MCDEAIHYVANGVARNIGYPMKRQREPARPLTLVLLAVTLLVAVFVILQMTVLNDLPRQLRARREYKQVNCSTFVETERSLLQASTLVYNVENQCALMNPLLQEDSVLVLVSAKGGSSWGKDRTAKSFLSLVSTLDYPKIKLSIGILISSKDEYHIIKQHVKANYEQYGFARISVFYRSDLSVSIVGESRKEDSIQRHRRRMLARDRNILLYNSLREWHEGVLWIDSDIIKIPSYLLRKMVDSGRDILQPGCYLKENSVGDYDRNAWKGPRIRPNTAELETLANGGLFVPRPAEGAQFVSDFAQGDDEYVEFDSVGGTVLYVKADIHRQGVTFIPTTIIGNDWEYEGYDGIESEGLCYLAKILGYKCWIMPWERVYHDKN